MTLLIELEAICERRRARLPHRADHAERPAAAGVGARPVGRRPTSRPRRRPTGPTRSHVAAPFAGVVTLPVAEGDEVAAGQTVATIEAMKMEASITAHDGRHGAAAGHRRRSSRWRAATCCWCSRDPASCAAHRCPGSDIARTGAQCASSPGVAGGRRLAVPDGHPAHLGPGAGGAVRALEHDPGLDGAARAGPVRRVRGARAGGAVPRGGARAVRRVRPAGGRGAAAQRRRCGLPGAEVRAAPAAAVLAGPADRRLRRGAGRPALRPAGRRGRRLARRRGHARLARRAARVVVVERAARSGDFAWPAPLHGVRERRYGDTVLHVGRRA